MTVRRPVCVLWILLLVLQALVGPLSPGPFDSQYEQYEPFDVPVSSAAGDLLKQVLPGRPPLVFRSIHHLGSAPDSPRSPPAA